MRSKSIMLFLAACALSVQALAGEGYGKHSNRIRKIGNRTYTCSAGTAKTIRLSLLKHKGSTPYINAEVQYNNGAKESWDLLTEYWTHGTHSPEVSRAWWTRNGIKVVSYSDRLDGGRREIKKSSELTLQFDKSKKCLLKIKLQDHEKEPRKTATCFVDESF